jgi:hypothetical protein
VARGGDGGRVTAAGDGDGGDPGEDGPRVAGWAWRNGHGISFCGQVVATVDRWTPGRGIIVRHEMHRQHKGAVVTPRLGPGHSPVTRRCCAGCALRWEGAGAGRGPSGRCRRAPEGPLAAGRSEAAGSGSDVHGGASSADGDLGVVKPNSCVSVQVHQGFHGGQELAGVEGFRQEGIVGSDPDR